MLQVELCGLLLITTFTGAQCVPPVKHFQKFPGIRRVKLLQEEWAQIALALEPFFSGVVVQKFWGSPKFISFIPKN